MAKYYTRYIEKQIETALHTSGAVLVTGPRFSGKTTTSMLFQKSYLKLNTTSAVAMAKIDPKGTITGEKPRLIDEWQTVPDIWNQVKNSLDENYEFGSYILTGSSTPAERKDIFHSGTGRITEVRMRPMSLYESGDSDGKVSLGDILEGKEIAADTNEDFTIERLAYLIARGGWPVSVLADESFALDVTRNYYQGLFNFENSENERFRNKRPEVLKMLVKSLARNISSEASSETIIKDIRQSNERTMDRKTFDEYHDALRDIFVIDDLEAWLPSFRSATVMRTSPIRHFNDPSVALASLDMWPADLLSDRETFGLFFEDFAVRDLRVYTEYLGGEVRHYRDSSGLECDAVLHFRNGKWGAVEIKLGGEENIEKGAASLLRLKRKLEEKSTEKAPSFLMVLVGKGPMYRRRDGVYVVPVNRLRA